MKKIFTLIALLAGTVSAMATDYTDRLEVTINGISSTQEATISVDRQADGKYTLQLNNFIMYMMGQPMPVGNIVLKDVTGSEADGTVMIRTAQGISITKGNIPGIDADAWIGPSLQTVPVDMTAELRGEKLYTVINIDMSMTLGQKIRVVFGDGGYQIGNSDFESFHTARVVSPEDPETFAESDEPDCWHSFMSASGDPALVYLAGYSPHTFVSDIVRPGTTGKKSVLLTSVDMWFTIANGTMTTGRINTGSITATDLANHSWSSADSVGTDAKGDPFYSAINGRPDSLAVWVKFKQATPNAEHPYATIKAVITDGSYYQDPEDKVYDNVVAKAVNDKIESNGYEWQRLTIPFEYESYVRDGAAPVEPKVIHVTISTNADAGQGSTDSLYVDDLELIYNCDLAYVAVKGQPVAGFSSDVTEYNIDGEGIIAPEDILYYGSKGIKVNSEVVPTEDGVAVKLTATSCDLKKSKVYTVNIKGASPTGITAVEGGNDKAEAVYDMSGRSVSSARKGDIYITKYADGKTVKAVKR